MYKRLLSVLLAIVFFSLPVFAGNYGGGGAGNYGGGGVTADIKDALDGANSPSSSNVFATMTDLDAADTGVQGVTAGTNLSDSGTDDSPIFNVTISEDVDMDTDYQLINLQAPAANGEAIRQTTKITEAILESLSDDRTTTAQVLLEYKLYRSALGEAYNGYIDIQLVISDRSDYDTPVVDVDTATSQTSWLAYGAASDSNEAWSASGMPSTDVRSIIYTGASLIRGTVYYYRWRSYKHGDTGTATDWKGGMKCL